MAASPLARLALAFLFAIGLNPKSKNRLSAYLAKLLFISFFILSLLMILEVAVNFDGLDNVNRLLYLPGTFICLSKCIFLISKQKNIRALLDAIESLWALDKFGPKIETEMISLRRFAYKSMKVYIYTGWMSFFFLVAKAMRDDELIFASYTWCDLKASTCYENWMYCQIIFIIFQAMPLTFAFDGFFLHLITEFYIGIEMTKIGFKQLFKDPKLFDEDVKEIVMQHDSILTLLNVTNKMYSKTLLLQFSSSLLSQMFCLYMLMLEGLPPDLNRLATFGFPYATFIVQLLLYCFGGDLIMSQTESLADAAYDVPWYEKDKIKLRKPLATIIQRSQRTKAMTIGNVVPLNLTTYLSILKNSLTLCGLLQTFATTNTN